MPESYEEIRASLTPVNQDRLDHYMLVHGTALVTPDGVVLSPRIAHSSELLASATRVRWATMPSPGTCPRHAVLSTQGDQHD